MYPLLQLITCGQSDWLNNLTRDMPVLMSCTRRDPGRSRRFGAHYSTFLLAVLRDERYNLAPLA